MKAADFRLLTDPRSVAVVGASNTVGSYGWRVLTILRGYGTGSQRSVYVVNPARAGQEVHGHRAYASLRDLPEAPECTLVIAPSAGVHQVLSDMDAVGSRAGVVLSAPHGAGPEEARRFDREVAEDAARQDLCLIGPNSMGLISPANGFAGTFASGMLSADGDDDPAPAGHVAMVSQSGAAISYLLEEHRGRRVGYSHLVSTGNETVVGFNDLLERLVDDPATTAIVLFVEAIHDGRRARRALQSARERGKTVVLMKIGSTDAGRVAAQSHSGRLAGGAAAYDALAADLGLIQVSGYQHLFDTVRLLSAVPAQRRRAGQGRAAVVTNSGGAAVAAIDELTGRGWSVPSLSSGVRARLNEALGRAGHNNPFDLLDLWRDEWRLPTTLRILGESGELDTIVVALGGGGPAAARVCTLAAQAAAELDLPVLFAGVGLRRDAGAALERGGAAFLPDLAGAVRGLTEILPPPARGAPAAAGGGHGNAARDAGGHGGARRAVPADELRGELERHGVRCAPSRVVPVTDDPAAAAAELGYPVAVKLEHPDLLHKSDARAVEIDIRSPTELAAASRRLAAAADAAGLSGAELLVQRMVKGVEVLVGARRDDAFGHVLVVGLGGVMTELLHDVRLALLPNREERIRELVCGHERLMSLLRGYRGGTVGDANALVAQVSAIAQWVAAQGDDLLEFDANPLMVTADGAHVVDARAVRAAGGGA